MAPLLCVTETVGVHADPRCVFTTLGLVPLMLSKIFHSPSPGHLCDWSKGLWYVRAAHNVISWNPEPMTSSHPTSDIHIGLGVNEESFALFQC